MNSIVTTRQLVKMGACYEGMCRFINTVDFYDQLMGIRDNLSLFQLLAVTEHYNTVYQNPTDTLVHIQDVEWLLCACDLDGDIMEKLINFINDYIRNHRDVRNLDDLKYRISQYKVCGKSSKIMIISYFIKVLRGDDYSKDVLIGDMVSGELQPDHVLYDFQELVNKLAKVNICNY